MKYFCNDNMKIEIFFFIMIVDISYVEMKVTNVRFFY